MSVAVGLLVKAKPGREADVVAFLESGQAIVEQESGTITWYAIKIDDSTFGIRHLQGRRRAAGPPVR